MTAEVPAHEYSQKSFEQLPYVKPYMEHVEWRADLGYYWAVDNYATSIRAANYVQGAWAVYKDLNQQVAQVTKRLADEKSHNHYLKNQLIKLGGDHG